MDSAYKHAMRIQLAEIEEELAEIKALEEKQGYLPTMAYRATERNLQLLVEACIGIAKQTLKSLGKNVPAEARQVFEKLRAEGQDTSRIPWNKVVGMRNALVHDYLNIERERIIDIIRQNHHQSLIRFAKEKTEYS